MPDSYPRLFILGEVTPVGHRIGRCGGGGGHIELGAVKKIKYLLLFVFAHALLVYRGGEGVNFIDNSCLYCNVYKLSTEKEKDEGMKITAFWYVSTSRLKRIMI